MKPFTSSQSREEAVKNGKKGGKASAKARKEKAEFREAAKWALEMVTTAKVDGEKTKITQTQAIVLNLLQKATSKEDRQSIEAAKVLLQLTDANKSAAEIRMLEAQAKLIEAKADLLTSADTNTLDKLDTILKEMRDDALKGGDA